MPKEKSNLTKARERCGLSIDDVKDAIHIGKSSLYRYEDGYPIPSDTLLKLSNLYKCDPCYLLGCINEVNHEVADIHDVTGLSVEAISVLSTMKKYNDDKHDPISPLILAFISQLITDVDFVVVERHIRARIDVETFEDIAEKNHLKEIRNALELRLLAEIDADNAADTNTLDAINSIQTIEDKKNERQDVVDAITFRLSHDVTNVLTSFSEKHMPIVREQMQRERDGLFHEYEEYRKRG